MNTSIKVLLRILRKDDIVDNKEVVVFRFIKEMSLVEALLMVSGSKIILPGIGSSDIVDKCYEMVHHVEPIFTPGYYYNINIINDAICRSRNLSVDRAIVKNFALFGWETFEE